MYLNIIIIPMMRICRHILLTFLTLPLAVMAHATDLNIAGIWVTEAGDAHVKIEDCGDGTPCGRLVWFQSNKGMTELDIYNPDYDLRGQPLLGTQIVWDFESKGDKWKSGKIYDAGKGKIYKSKLSLNPDGSLKVRGCVGPICDGQNWTRLQK